MTMIEELDNRTDVDIYRPNNLPCWAHLHSSEDYLSVPCHAPRLVIMHLRHSLYFPSSLACPYQETIDIIVLSWATPTAALTPSSASPQGAHHPSMIKVNVSSSPSHQHNTHFPLSTTHSASTITTAGIHCNNGTTTTNGSCTPPPRRPSPSHHHFGLATSRPPLHAAETILQAPRRLAKKRGLPLPSDRWVC